MNNPQLLIDAVVQQTMVFIAHLATAGGIRAPLAGVANQVFAELTHELERQGVRKKVIADMFGMALRTYHRRSQELRLSRTEEGRTLWEAVYGFLREKKRVSARDVLHRFRHDDGEMVTGILSDLVGSGLLYRAGRGNTAVYKLADDEELGSDEGRLEAASYLVWLTVYRNGPVGLSEIVELTHLEEDTCRAALEELVQSARIRAVREGDRVRYESDVLDVPLGSSRGWEAAVLDHFQAVTNAISHKLTRASEPSGRADTVGGSTWSLDVWEGHPLLLEAEGTLRHLRAQLEELRGRVDRYNQERGIDSPLRRVVVYVGQYVREDDAKDRPL